VGSELALGKGVLAANRAVGWLLNGAGPTPGSKLLAPQLLGGGAWAVTTDAQTVSTKLQAKLIDLPRRRRLVDRVRFPQGRLFSLEQCSHE
jgi:hypothetical protein